ncbi:MAG: hypothetical protein CK532_01190 [Flavobacteriales bacterium]|nr:MAG: hypothetical protein CK532_01190 [Flavobacteriales bacterium]
MDYLAWRKSQKIDTTRMADDVQIRKTASDAGMLLFRFYIGRLLHHITDFHRPVPKESYSLSSRQIPSGNFNLSITSTSTITFKESDKHHCIFWLNCPL